MNVPAGSAIGAWVFCFPFSEGNSAKETPEAGLFERMFLLSLITGTAFSWPLFSFYTVQFLDYQCSNICRISLSSYQTV